MTLQKPSRLLRLSGLFAAGALLAGCGQSVAQSDSEPAGSTQRIVENCGRTLAFDAPVQRAVAMSPGQSDMLVRLDQADKVVGEAQSHGQPLQGELATLGIAKQLSDEEPPSREVLLAVSPDFIYSPTSYEFTAEQGYASIEQLEESGAASYIATAGCSDRRSTATVADLLTDIKNLGTIFEVPDAAEKLSATARASLDKVAAAVTGRDKPTTAELYIEGNSIYAIGAGLEYNMLQLAGADNVFNPDDQAFAEFFSAVITPETLVAKNPEAIVISSRNQDHAQDSIDYLKKTFPEVDAVKNSRFITVDSNDLMPGSWNNIEVVEHIAQGLHPDAF